MGLPTVEKCSFQWQSVLEKAAGRDPVSTDAFGNGGMDLALAGLGKGTFSEKRSPSPMLLTPSKPLCSGMCRYAIRPAPLLQKRRGSG